MRGTKAVDGLLARRACAAPVTVGVPTGEAGSGAERESDVDEGDESKRSGGRVCSKQHSHSSKLMRRRCRTDDS